MFLSHSQNARENKRFGHKTVACNTALINSYMQQVDTGQHKTINETNAKYVLVLYGQGNYYFYWGGGGA
jgi:hypothetical protein